jgi:hypothetical protein
VIGAAGTEVTVVQGRDRTVPEVSGEVADGLGGLAPEQQEPLPGERTTPVGLGWPRQAPVGMTPDGTVEGDQTELDGAVEGGY